MIWGTLALAFAAAFTGASFYVNWVEQPARLKLDDAALLSEWGPSDSRGVALLVALALVSAIAGFIAYFETQDVRWAFGAVIIIAKLALRLLRHVAARQPGPLAARRRRGGGARPRSPVGHCRIGIDGDRGGGGPRVPVGPPLSGAPHGLGSPRRFAPPPATSPTRCVFHPPALSATPAPAAPLDIDRIAWAAPVAGAVVGLIGALVLALTALLGLPLLLRAGLATAALVAATGALHEDGLADVADGFGGGATRERKLEIMRDSRIGAYGAIALALALILRVGALTAALDGGFWRAGLSLILVAALSRAGGVDAARASAAGARRRRGRRGRPARLERARRRLGLGRRYCGRARPRCAWHRPCAPRGAHERRRGLACCGAGASRDRRTDWRRSGRCATIRRDRRLVRTSHRTYIHLSKGRAFLGPFQHANFERAHRRELLLREHRDVGLAIRNLDDPGAARAGASHTVAHASSCRNFVLR